MKKLMITVVSICVTVLVHAGAYTWGLSNDSNRASNGAYLTDGDFTVMLFTGTIGETANGDGTYALDFSGAKFVTKSSAYNPSTYSIGEFAFDAGRTSANVDGSAQPYAMLVLDTGANLPFENYEGTYAIVAGTGAINQDKESSTFFTQFTSSTGITADMYNTASSGSPEPVPEPTSGLLLLIGVAGVALRRRRV